MCSDAFEWFFPTLRQFPHMHVLWLYRILNRSPELALYAVPSCSVLGPANPSCPGPPLSPPTPQYGETAGLCPSTQPLHCSLETPDKKLGQSWAQLICIDLPGVTVLCQLKSSVLKTIALYILSGHFIVISRKVNWTL